MGSRVPSNWQVMGKVVNADLSRVVNGLAWRAKLVLLRMAWSINATENGSTVVWPSINLVARDTHLSRSTVKRALHDLEDAELITKEDAESQWSTTRWRVEHDAIAALKFPRLKVAARRPNTEAAVAERRARA
jgi:DNA-binding transcriptional ArsR family regulator